MAHKMSGQDLEKLADCFEEMEVVPKLDSSADLQQWMLDYLQGQGRLAGVREPTSTQEHKSGSKTTHIVHTPKIFAFAGEPDKDSTFESWKYEILTLLKEGSYSERTITTAAKKSLRGDAAKLVRRLGVDATIREMLDKFQVMYGRVEDPSDLLTEFHQAIQEPSETVSSWCCRIEDLLYRALEDDPAHITRPDETLRLKFYSGLRKEIKDRIRHHKDNLRDIDKLLYEARRAEIECTPEQECMKTKKPVQVRMVNAEDHVSEVETLKGSICQLNTKVDKLSSTLQAMAVATHQTPGRNTNYHRGRGGGQSRGNQNWNQYRNQNWSHNHNQNWPQTFNSRQAPGSNQVHQAHQDHSFKQHDVNHRTHNAGYRPGNQIICFRCGQEGHKAYGCCVDLSTQTLNQKESV